MLVTFPEHFAHVLMNDPFIKYYCSSNTGHVKTLVISLTTTAKDLLTKKALESYWKPKKKLISQGATKGFKIFDKFVYIRSVLSLSHSFTRFPKVSIAIEKQTNRAIVLSL